MTAERKPISTRPRLADFEADPRTGVLLAPHAGTPAGYLDGAERRLLEALPGVADRSTGSQELAALVRDWPTEYHLTPYRTTIFDCLGLNRARTARVLELGCGCGAITRWLGERCGEVHAIEGDPARAHIAALRCEDLDNVRVYSANYSELDELSGFDIATLIGVLEYGHLYHPSHRDDPDAAAVANLRLAREALADAGVLVLAIENRLGLKYLNGAREDHSGRLFEGIQGYPDRSSPTTWSARALERMLRESGFASVDLLLPFPDYKLARTIVNPARCTDAHAVHNWIDAPAPDRGVVRGPALYNEHLATREVARAGLLPDLSNSFLALAWAGDRRSSMERLGIRLDWAARHYALDRKPGLRKQVTLGDVVVDHAPMAADDAVRRDREAIGALGLHHGLGAEAHRPGDALLFSVFESLVLEGIGPRFHDHLVEFRGWLLGRFPAATRASGAVDGSACDATWWNVMVHPQTGEWQLIDEEWRLDRPVPVDFLVWRMVHHFALRYAVDLPPDVSALAPRVFADACVQVVAPDLEPWVLDAFAHADAAIQHAVAPGGDVDPQALDLLFAMAAPSASYTIVGLAPELSRNPALLSTYGQLGEEVGAATLVVYAPGQPPEDAATALRAAMERAGVDETSCDLVLLAVPDTPDAERSIAEQADAILSDTAVRASFAGLPRFGSGDETALRAAIATATALSDGPGLRSVEPAAPV